MLKLEQINITESDALIAEILEPVVYTHVGSVLKTDDIISREKDRTPYLLARVVKETKKGALSVLSPPQVLYKVNDIIMIPRSALNPITFPIEGYDSPKLSVINIYSIFAKIEEEASHSPV